jgi:hypothetical protein
MLAVFLSNNHGRSDFGISQGRPTSLVNYHRIEAKMVKSKTIDFTPIKSEEIYLMERLKVHLIKPFLIYS